MLVASGKITSWLKGTAIVIPLNAKLIVSVLELAEQGMYANVGVLEYGVSPRKAQMEVARSCGSPVIVVPESRRMLIGVVVIRPY